MKYIVKIMVNGELDAFKLSVDDIQYLFELVDSLPSLEPLTEEENLRL